MTPFVMRTSKPEAGNKYYIRKISGGYSNAIQGYPTDPECDVLSNCVGYAYGRFNEIGGYGCCRYLASVNAENFMQYKGSCESGQSPRLGACMVWKKGPTLSGSDGAGHVAIVEKVISETEVFTSESGYGSKAFWNQTRKKGADGRWGASSAYTFLGFIYNPAIDSKMDEIATVDDSGNSKCEVKVGDIVSISEDAVYYSGKRIPDRIKCRKWIVKDIRGDRAVIDQSVDGLSGINSPINVCYLRILSHPDDINEKDSLPNIVRVTVSALNIRNGPGTNNSINGIITDYGEYEILETSVGEGASLWGRLKNGTGWIALDYTQKVE